MHYLLIDDDIAFTQTLARSLSRKGASCTSCHSAEEAIKIIASAHYDRAIIDLKMTGKSGLSVIPTLKQQHPNIDIIMLTGYSSIATAVEAVKLGALNYLCKPASLREILAAFGDVTEATKPVEIPSQPHSVDRLEWEHIQKILQENNNNISATARALNMHRRTLQRKLQKKPVQH